MGQWEKLLTPCIIVLILIYLFLFGTFRGWGEGENSAEFLHGLFGCSEKFGKYKKLILLNS